MESLDNIPLQLELTQALAHQLDRVVRQANQTVLLLERNGLKENQLRNVINVASTVSSIEAVVMFIRYQIARERGWREPRDFGEEVIKDIRGEVRAAAQEAVDGLQTKTDDTAHIVDVAHRELTRQYLGYLNRAFTYCTKAPDGYQKLRASMEATANVQS